MTKLSNLEVLIKNGVGIPNPDSVEIGEDIIVDHISNDGVTIHAGSRIYGKETYIARGARIGYEAPATVENCYIGPQVELKGGFFQGAVFLKGAACGSGAHVRTGTILEEGASIAHTVGLKQTILFPFVTLGSLINFCDCLMTGGTSRQDHSEVGSSYIHFNYTPNQDKATASLIGDVSRGVMLNQAPIFLGGQGGLVGPCRIAFGTILAAGSICRNDQLTQNRLVLEGNTRNGSIPFKPGGFRNINRTLVNNFYYIGNLLALLNWYRFVRSRFIGPDLPEILFDGLLATVTQGIDERIGQLSKLCEKMKQAKSATGLHRQFCDQWHAVEEKLYFFKERNPAEKLRNVFIGAVFRRFENKDASYLQWVKSLRVEQALSGTTWLDAVVGCLLEEMAGLLPAIRYQTSS